MFLRYQSMSVVQFSQCYSFLPRDASAERGDATVSCPSVRDV